MEKRTAEERFLSAKDDGSRKKGAAFDKEALLELVRDLSLSRGAPGFEQETVAVLKKALAPFGELEEDPMQNLYLHRRGNRSGRVTVQLDAHTDEVAFMLQSIGERGEIRVLALGGWSPNSVLAQRFQLRNRRGEWLPAISSSVPPHFLSEEERKRAFRMEDLQLDLGASSAEELTRDYGVRLGEPIVPDSPFQYDEARDRIMGKAFDCRLGCAAIVELLRRLDGAELNVNLVAAFSVQEELGMRGAQVSVQRVQPDLALVFEGCPADDSFLPSHEAQTALGKGPMLRHLDNRMLTHPAFQRYALDLAEKSQIPVQEAVRRGGSTDGAPIHLSAKATPAIVLGVPVRYIHSHHGIAALSDVVWTARLAEEILRSLPTDAMAAIR